MTSHSSTLSRQWTVEFRTLPSRTGQIRRIVCAMLRYRGLEALAERAAVGVTELLAGLQHRTAPAQHCTVELALRRERLVVRVRGHEPPLPRVRPPGAPPDDAGRAVWFALPVPAAAPADPLPAPEPAPRRRPAERALTGAGGPAGPLAPPA